MSFRGIVALGVLAAWGAGVAVFMHRESNRSPRERLAEAALRVAPGATYLMTEQGDRHIGFASVTIDTVRDGLEITNYAVRDGDGKGSEREVTRVVSRLSRGLWMREIEVAAPAPGIESAVASVLNDSTLQVRIDRGDKTDTVVYGFSAPLLTPELVPLAVALDDRTKPGMQFAFDVFDPSQLAVRKLDATIVAESMFVVLDSAVFAESAHRWIGARADSVRGYRMRLDEGAIDLWVDDLGKLILSHEESGRTQTRTAYEIAFENWRLEALGRPVRSTTTREPTSEALLSSLRSLAPLESLVVVATGIDLSRVPRSRWQEVAGDTVRRSRQENVSAAGYWLPPSQSFRREFARDLQVSPGIEVEDPSIVSRARILRRGYGDPVALTRQIARWVADSVRLEWTLSPPSAIAALRSRAGDSEHHTALFIALARAAGIPSRAVAGLIVRDSLVLPHAWAEVWVGNTWLAVDPSFGQVPAGAEHIKLAGGGVGVRRELQRIAERARFRILRAASSTGKSE